MHKTVTETVMNLSAGPLLLIDPPSNSGRLLGVGLGSSARIQPGHPLLQGLDLVTLQDEAPSVSGEEFPAVMLPYFLSKTGLSLA